MQPWFGLDSPFCTVKYLYSALLQPEEHSHIFKGISDSCIQISKVFVATYYIVYSPNY